MLTEDLAFFVNNITALNLLRDSVLKETSIVGVGNETEFLALNFFSGSQLILPGEVADLGFRVFTEGHHRTAQLLLCERGEEIRLVFADIPCFA